MIIDEYAAGIVRTIFNMKLEGYSAGKIADWLNASEVQTPFEYKRACGFNYNSGYRISQNPVWNASSVTRILTNECYTGMMVQGINRKINYKVKESRPVDAGEWIKVADTHETIIPRNIFDSVQELLRLDTRTASGEEMVNVFSGLVRCGDCEQNMVKCSTTKKGKKYYYYHCTTYKNTGDCSAHLISVDKLYDAVLAQVQLQIKKLIQADSLLKEVDAKDFSRKVTAYNDLHRERGDVKLLRSVYGYKRDAVNNIYVVNPDTAPIVQMIFRWYLLGVTTGQIAKRLNMMQILTPLAYKAIVEKGEEFDQDGDAWNNGHVRDILRNTIYIGDLTWGKRRKTLFRNVPEHKTPREEWVICHNMHEPIISKADFEEVQRRLDEMADKLKSPKDYEYNPPDPFPSKVYCLDCGKKCITQSIAMAIVTVLSMPADAVKLAQRMSITIYRKSMRIF